jgi:hypothetical protein
MVRMSSLKCLRDGWKDVKYLGLEHVLVLHNPFFNSLTRRRKIVKILPVSMILVVMLVAASFLNSPIVQNGVAANSSRRFGFGYVDPGCLLISGCDASSAYSASTFFNAYFLTPPYPSSVMFIMPNNDEFAASSVLSWLKSVMQSASAYPNIKLGMEIAFDPTNAAGWTDFRMFLSAMSTSRYSSTVGFIGIDQEHVRPSSTMTPTDWVNFFNWVQGNLTVQGIPDVNLYPQGLQITHSLIPTIQWLGETNYPQGDNQAALSAGVGQSWNVGEAIGLDSYQPFPSPGCTSIYGGSFPGWSIRAFSQGYLGSDYNNPVSCDNIVTNAGYPNTIQQALSVSASNPVANRQWVFINAGNAGSCFLGPHGGSRCGLPFTGVSGHSTITLWDNPVFRRDMTNWLAANQGTYVTSNGRSESTRAAPTITTTLSHLAITAGQSVKDSATLKGDFQAGGSVTYESFSGGTCSGTPTKVGTAVTVKNGIVPNSASQVFKTVGTYSWKAVYSGDANNKGATSPCERMTILPAATPPTHTTITCTKTSFAVGTRITCTAIVTGGHSPRTGTITWSKASGTGGVTFSSKTSTLTSGWCWVTLKATVRGSITIKATYSGDPHNPWSAGTILVRALASS